MTKTKKLTITDLIGKRVSAEVYLNRKDCGALRLNTVYIDGTLGQCVGFDHSYNIWISINGKCVAEIYFFDYEVEEIVGNNLKIRIK